MKHNDGVKPGFLVEVAISAAGLSLGGETGGVGEVDDQKKPARFAVSVY